ncbi:L-rhamnose mutarotase [Stappia stellulata]|uniref:L-rhamnose mutarotase n=1 Tax=Stappia stellulata TaxID=71235 RepID=UPI000491F80D|nr:L-rhamnose mutarotase [Stappia stellulata]
MQRMGLCIGLKAGQVARYRDLHAAVWPDVLSAISHANIRNYSIFLKEPENLLFAYWEYVGTDFEQDMQVMRDTPVMQDWWKICDPLQQPLATRGEGEWWALMESVFWCA